MLTAEEVIVAYRHRSKPPPESNDIVNHCILSTENLETLFFKLISSLEFQDRVRANPNVQQAWTPATLAVRMYA